jgi:hypothetical protein
MPAQGQFAEQTRESARRSHGHDPPVLCAAATDPLGFNRDGPSKTTLLTHDALCITMLPRPEAQLEKLDEQEGQLDDN